MPKGRTYQDHVEHHLEGSPQLQNKVSFLWNIFVSNVLCDMKK